MLRRQGTHIVESVMIAMALGVGACGGGDSEQTYSANRFLECLPAKDVGPKNMETGGSEGDRYFDALDQSASQAARQNGLLERRHLKLLIFANSHLANTEEGSIAPSVDIATGNSAAGATDRNRFLANRTLINPA